MVVVVHLNTRYWDELRCSLPIESNLMKITVVGIFSSFGMSWECGTLFDKVVESNKKSLVIGAPGHKALERVSEIMKKAALHVLDTVDGESGAIFQYGPGKGSPLYCREVAQFLCRQYQNDVKPTELLLTSGATNGLHLVTSLLLEPGSAVYVEDPTYFLAISTLRDDLCMNLMSVSSADDGIDTVALETVLKERKPVQKDQNNDQNNGRFNAMVYAVPTYNNPKSHCYSEDKCRRLISLARKYNILLLCDDVYNILHWDATQPPPKRLLQYDKEEPGYIGHVISNGSFSKLLGPGLRCGWIEASEKIISVMCETSLIRSSGSVNHFTSQLIVAALQQGWVDEIVTKTNQEFLVKSKVIQEIFTRMLQKELSFHQPEGGYFYWLVFDPTVDTQLMTEYLKDNYNVLVMPGIETSLTKSYTNCMRISISYYDLETLEKTIVMLCKGVKEYLSLHPV